MRIKWIDRWRGVLITLVVMGHVVGEGFHYTHGDTKAVFDLWYKVIYSFHMPAFFVLAGIVWSDKGYVIKRYVVGKFKRLMVPYLFWGIVSAGIYVAFSRFLPTLFGGASSDAYIGKGWEAWWMPFVSIIHAGGWPGGEGFQSNSVLWFLPVLFSVEIAFFFLHRIVSEKLSLFLIAIICLCFQYCVMRYIPILPLGLHKLPLYMPFFICGNLLKPTLRRENEFTAHRMYLALLVCIIIAYWIVCYALPNKAITRHSVFWSFQFGLLALAGSFISMAVAMMIKNDLMVFIGKASLAIMLLHKFVLILILNIFHVASLFKSSNAIIAIVLSILATVIAVVVSCAGYRIVYRFAPKTLGIWE